MDLLKKICALFVLIFALHFEATIADPIARVYCTFDGVAAFDAHFRLFTNGDSSITGLQAYNSSFEPTNLALTPVPLNSPDCIKTSTDPESNQLYTLEIAYGSCGSDVGNVLIRALGTDRYYEFICIAGLQTSITTSITAAKTVDYRRHFPNPYNIQLQVVEHGGSNAPLETVSFGQDIKIRVIFDKNDMEEVPDNWAKAFHVAYVPHVNATELVLQIVTRGTGTLVNIDGNLSGKTINAKRYVKRNTALEFVVPVEYAQTSSTLTSWDIENRGISISADSLIGVRAISSNGDGSSYVVIPDDALGSTYMIPFFNPPNLNGEVVVIGTVAGTSLTIVYQGFTIPPGLMINGIAVPGGSVSTSLTINACEVLTIKCGTECFFLQILSTDQNVFAVMYGFENQPHFYDTMPYPGHSMTQLIPFRNYHDKFVLAHPTGFDGIFFLQNKLPFPSVAFSDKGVSTTIAPFYSVNELTSYDSEVALGMTYESAFYFYSIAGGPNGDPALLSIPSRAQWSYTNSFYAKFGSTYSLTFVGTNLDDIEIWADGVETNLDASMTLGNQTSFTTSPIAPILGGTPTYSKASVQVTLSDRNHGLIEFRAGNKWSPFMLLIIEEKGTYISTYLAYGVGYPVTYQCTPTTVMRPGDGIDNDCDGLTDEEFPNNIDDDSDGKTDEDIMTDSTSEASGVYISSLNVCDGSLLNCRYVISDGCFTPNASFDYPFSPMGKFKHNTDLADVFDHLYILDSEVFEAWRFSEDGDVVLYVTYKMCFGNLTRCESSCVTKRSVDEEDNEDEMGVSLRIRFDKNSMKQNQSRIDTTKSDSIKKHACTNNPVFWVPVTILLAILVVESCATVFFMYKRSQFIKIGHIFNY